MIEFEREHATGDDASGPTAEATDPTLQSLARALGFALELQGRYRVYHFEAAQDGRARTAEVLQQLRETHGRQIAALRGGFVRRLDALGAHAADELDPAKREATGPPTRPARRQRGAEDMPTEVAK